MDDFCLLIGLFDEFILPSLVAEIDLLLDLSVLALDGLPFWLGGRPTWGFDWLGALLDLLLTLFDFSLLSLLPIFKVLIEL